MILERKREKETTLPFYYRVKNSGAGLIHGGGGGGGEALCHRGASTSCSSYCSFEVYGCGIEEKCPTLCLPSFRSVVGCQVLRTEEIGFIHAGTQVLK